MNGATIAAPATAPGRGALAVVRISGPRTRALVEARLGKTLPDRRAVLVDWKDASGRTLDSAVATFFAGPRSYTGEDSLELSLHGNPLIVQAVLEDLHAAGVRLAQPGEFTRRAVENGRLGLVEAESVALLVAAETRAALRNAQRILAGELRGRVESLRAALLDLSVRLELSVDFAEEDLSPEETGVELMPLRLAAGEALAALEALLASHARARRRSVAPRAVFVGRPNAGKSSLINALLGEERLIVSPIAGTTRDWVEAPLLLPRGAIHLVDTAGLGDPRDALDALAQERSRAVLETAHLAVLVVEAGRSLDEGERALLAARPDEEWLVVRTKADIAPGEAAEAETGEFSQLTASARTGTGLEALALALAERLLPEGDEDEPPAVATERQRQAVEAARERLAACCEALEAGAVEIAAHETRGAIACLRELVGELPPETVLEQVFTSFCIGK